MNKPTKIQDFKKLSIKSYKDIHKDMELYSGDVSFKVLSDVYASTNGGLWIDVLKVYEDGFTFKDNISLADNNVTNGGYNPWMLFEDKEIAKLHSDGKWLIDSENCEFTDQIENKWVNAPIGEILSNHFIMNNFEVK